MAMMMSSSFLEATGDGGRIAGEGTGGRFTSVSDHWMGTMDAAMPFAGLDASPYAASPTPLHSPETPSLDNTVFPSPMADFAYLDRPFGDFHPSGYGIPTTAAGQFPPVRSNSHRTSTSLSEGYDLASAAASPPLGTVWPAHVSPAATFLPTPPMGDELSAADSAELDDNDRDQDDQDDEEEEEQEDKDAGKKRKRGAAASAKGKATKRQQTQLRTASRAPKKRNAATPRRPSETMEEVKARAAHNQVEQQYRKRLNGHFERLLAVLPSPGRDGSDRRVSKAEVLDLARERITALERQTARLERERKQLRGRIGGLESSLGRRMV